MTLIDLTAPAVRDNRLDVLPVAVIGAGPIGLAAAANLTERGIPFVVYEAGDAVADSIAQWAHIRLFSPWKHLVDPASRRLLEDAGWQHPANDGLPTGGELIGSYLHPLAALPQLAEHIHTGVEIVAVSRAGMDRTRTAGRAQTPFLLRLRDDDGTVTEVTARAVIDSSGTYRSPNSLASSGLDPLGLPEVADLVSHALPDVLGHDRIQFAGRHTVVVGAGHSAANTLLNLAQLADTEAGTTISWVIRNASAVRVTSSADDELAARASIGRRVDQLVADGRIEVVDRFEIIRLHRDDDRIALTGSRAGTVTTLTGDTVVNATGFRPDLDMLREIRLDLDEIVEAPRRLAPLIDPNIHNCGTVAPHGVTELRQPEPDFYLAGMKSYGRAPTFFLATGYEQVRSIVAHLDGDHAAASAVALTLPATGVGSSDQSSEASCCGTATEASWS
ncbi:NAD(P)-binding domain-containing protein [Leifsonia sp. Leaf264]|uniref:NAD(P)-binding domain-containing protein n=1 Tax=Leifsonia sp. Leaf264 TaxID=1736314 RepID=UPI0006FD6ECC|nr:NAD(P)-binding domain-containing protein [Leifsonia sp. Leaf264]KQP02065.1 flavoprotein [Leifsonia sp. Leaf264]